MNTAQEAHQLARSALDISNQLSDTHYSSIDHGISAASVGAHLRHVMDHFDCFLDGLALGKIDYSNRQRDMGSEQNRLLMIQRISHMSERLMTISYDANTPIQVRSGISEPACFVQSSIDREIDFLISHSIHHFAMIKMILERFDYVLPAEFGVAPSTLEYNRQKT